MQQIINKNAAKNSSLNKKANILHLPEGLNIIKTMSFVDCQFQEVIIPHSVMEIQERAFRWCNRLKKVTILNQDTKVAIGAFYECGNIEEIIYGNCNASDKLFHLIGKPFLVQHVEISANLNHTLCYTFTQLTTLCAQGNSNAMFILANWFERWSNKSNASLFYIRAANYWRYRAYRKGNKEAVKWFNQYFADYPMQQLESIISESSDHRRFDYHHNIPGKLLNDLGLSFFDSEREYDIKQFEDEEIVEVSAFAEYVGPDEDGFGEEYNYDWWFLDENMQPIPGIGKIHAEVKETDQEQFQEMRAKAIATIRQKL